MNNRVIYLSGLLITFVLGCLVTYITMTKRQMDAIMANTGQISQSTSNQVSKPQIKAINDNSTSSTVRNMQNLQAQTDVNNANPKDIITNDKNNDALLSVNDYSQSQAQAIVDDMPDYVLEQYVDKFMAKDASDVIADKRQFAKRAVEELYTANDNQALNGDVKLSLYPAMPTNSLDTSIINKDAKLYAHLDISSSRGRVPASPYVFIKWVNNQTGQVLLFEQKSIIADSDQNWVSFKPDDGWQVGSYDIRFYQFTSELQPIAQLTYDIYEVIDDES